MADLQRRPEPRIWHVSAPDPDRTAPPVVPLPLADAAFRVELEELVREARRAEAVFVRHDADVVGAWERLADRLDLVQRAYALWRARSMSSDRVPGAVPPAGAGR